MNSLNKKCDPFLHLQQHRRLRLAEELREQERASEVLRATTSIQTVFRWWQRQLRDQRIRTELLEKKRSRQKIDVASSRVQRAWRRHRVAVIDRRKRWEKEAPPLPPLSSVVPGESYSEQSSVRTGTEITTQESVSGTSGDRRKILGARPDEQQSGSDMPRREKKSARSPRRAAAIAWEGSGAVMAAAVAVTAAAATTGSDRYPEESDKAKESSPSPVGLGGLPPAGMMTVRVRRGSEEESLVTPIVLTESGVAAASEAAVEGEEVDPSLDGEQKSAARPWAVQGGSPNAETVNSSSRANFSGEGFAHGDAQFTEEAHGKNAAEPVTPVVPTTEVTVTHGRKNEANDARSKFLASAAVANGSGSEKIEVSKTREAVPARPWSAVASTKPWAAPDETKAEAEQFFMEDSQVYLGCANCGVKYLVEAVDPGLSESTQGDY